MTEPTNLERAMWAENALCEFDTHARSESAGYGLRPVEDLYDMPEDVAKDLITDLCHFLHMDDRAGRMSRNNIECLLQSAFRMFETEQEEALCNS